MMFGSAYGRQMPAYGSMGMFGYSPPTNTSWGPSAAQFLARANMMPYYQSGPMGAFGRSGSRSAMGGSFTPGGQETGGPSPIPGMPTYNPPVNLPGAYTPAGQLTGGMSPRMPVNLNQTGGLSPLPQQPQFTQANQTGGMSPIPQMPRYTPALTGGLTPMDPQQGVSYSPMDPGMSGRVGEMMGRLNGGGMPVNLMPPMDKPMSLGSPPSAFGMGQQQFSQAPFNTGMFAQNYANVAGFQMPGAMPAAVGSPNPTQPPQFQSLADPPPFSQGGQPSGYRNDGFSTVPSRQGGGYFQGGLGGRYIPNVGNAMNGLDTLARFGLNQWGMPLGRTGAY